MMIYSLIQPYKEIELYTINISAFRSSSYNSFNSHSISHHPSIFSIQLSLNLHLFFWPSFNVTSTIYLLHSTFIKLELGMFFLNLNNVLSEHTINTKDELFNWITEPISAIRSEHTITLILFDKRKLQFFF